MLDDILFLEGERRDMVLELPIGSLNEPVDITYTLEMVYEVPVVSNEHISVFV